MRLRAVRNLGLTDLAVTSRHSNPKSQTLKSPGKGYTLFAPMAGELSFDVDVSQALAHEVQVAMSAKATG